MVGRGTRRTFLRNAALGGMGFLLLNDSRSARTYAANERVNLAIVGVSGRGGWFSETMPKLANVVAMCDVNDRRAAPYYKAIPQARTFHDFRRMLEEMGGQIDAVTVATPDHTHAAITAAAIRRGKHVLCEKPLTHDVFEARMLRALAREYKVATQMGNQGTASEAFRRGVELIQAGTLGQIREVHAWNTGGGAGERPIPTEEHPVPDFLQWDLWLGPAKFRPYNSRWAEWHSWRDFATGELGNWGCHTMNILFKGLRIDSLWNESSGRTIRLDVEVSGVHEATFPKWEIIRYAIPARGEMPPVTVNWYNGGGRAPGPREKIEEMIGRKLDWGDAGEKKWADHAGCVLVGDRGMIHSTGHNASMTVLPEGRLTDAEKPAKSLPRSRGHEVEWLDACRGGPAAMSNFDYSGPLTEFVLLGNVATLFGKSIEYDPVAMEVTNSAEANEALKREYRVGWSL
ncbi:MAG TPA: Gfo/Idh/MocA family oxidoreductase [Sedimentisphaerales bacterium]|nr:Gfo/Idh/MocA family oxidoreductase [Phycisphaerae bacterium]HON90412.1 Gfo/Idh/MocA family oxidoreductase [Sedimentisphaerales bacterium]HQI27542.1 Gfo/Idh/MocA family oxidoreductase [Sedimentisphaerales bacterium]